MSAKRKAAVAIVSSALAITLAFIWGNSFIPTAQSAKESEGTLFFMQPFFDFIFGKGVITESIFRKIAHASEFFLLSFEICLLYYFIGRYGGGKKFFEIISLGLFAAVVDESIQIISGRGPMVRDILIDFSGVVFAAALFFVCYLIARKIKKANATKKGEVK